MIKRTYDKKIFHNNILEGSRIYCTTSKKKSLLVKKKFFNTKIEVSTETLEKKTYKKIEALVQSVNFGGPRTKNLEKINVELKPKILNDRESENNTLINWTDKAHKFSEYSNEVSKVKNGYLKEAKAQLAGPNKKKIPKSDVNKQVKKNIAIDYDKTFEEVPKTVKQYLLQLKDVDKSLTKIMDHKKKANAYGLSNISSIDKHLFDADLYKQEHELKVACDIIKERKPNGADLKNFQEHKQLKIDKCGEVDPFKNPLDIILCEPDKNSIKNAKDVYTISNFNKASKEIDKTLYEGFKRKARQFGSEISTVKTKESLLDGCRNLISGSCCLVMLPITYINLHTKTFIESEGSVRVTVAKSALESSLKLKILEIISYKLSFLLFPIFFNLIILPQLLKQYENLSNNQMKLFKAIIRAAINRLRTCYWKYYLKDNQQELKEYYDLNWQLEHHNKSLIIRIKISSHLDSLYMAGCLEIKGKNLSKLTQKERLSVFDDLLDFDVEHLNEIFIINFGDNKYKCIYTFQEVLDKMITPIEEQLKEANKKQNKKTSEVVTINNQQKEYNRVVKRIRNFVIRLVFKSIISVLNNRNPFSTDTNKKNKIEIAVDNSERLLKFVNNKSNKKTASIIPQDIIQKVGKKSQITASVEYLDQELYDQNFNLKKNFSNYTIDKTAIRFLSCENLNYYMSITPKEFLLDQTTLLGKHLSEVFNSLDLDLIEYFSYFLKRFIHVMELGILKGYFNNYKHLIEQFYLEYKEIMKKAMRLIKDYNYYDNIKYNFESQKKNFMDHQFVLGVANNYKNVSNLYPRIINDYRFRSYDISKGVSLTSNGRYLTLIKKARQNQKRKRKK